MPACILRVANPFFAYVSLKNLQASFLFSGENSNEPIFGRMNCLQDRWAKMVQMSLRSKRMSNAKHYEWSFRQIGSLRRNKKWRVSKWQVKTKEFQQDNSFLWQC